MTLQADVSAIEAKLHATRASKPASELVWELTRAADLNSLEGVEAIFDAMKRIADGTFRWHCRRALALRRHPELIELVRRRAEETDPSRAAQGDRDAIVKAISEHDVYEAVRRELDKAHAPIDPETADEIATRLCSNKRSVLDEAAEEAVKLGYHSAVQIFDRVLAAPDRASPKAKKRFQAVRVAIGQTHDERWPFFFDERLAVESDPKVATQLMWAVQQFTKNDGLYGVDTMMDAFTRIGDKKFRAETRRALSYRTHPGLPELAREHAARAPKGSAARRDLLAVAREADQVVAVTQKRARVSGKTQPASQPIELRTGAELGERAFRHQGPIARVALSDDGERALVVGGDGRFGVWDIASGERITSGDGGNATGTWVDGRRISKPHGVLPGVNQCAFVRSSTGDPIWPKHGHRAAVTGVAALPDGGVVSCSLDRTLRIWALDRAEETAVIEGGAYFLTSVACSRDGRVAATSSSYHRRGDRTLQIWSLDEQRPTARLGSEGYGAEAALTADGSLAALARSDHVIEVFDVPSGELRHRLRGHQWQLCSVCFDAEGEHIVSGGADETLRVWRVDTGELLHTFVEPRGFVDAVVAVPGTPFAVGAAHSVVAFDIAAGKAVVRVHDGGGDGVVGLAASHDGRHVAALYASGLTVFEVGTWGVAGSFDLDDANDRAASVTFTADDRHIVIGTSCGMLRVVDC